MPELPEVQTVVNDLNSKIKGDKIIGFWSDWKKTIKKMSGAKFAREIKDRKILGARRIGKNLFIDLSKKILGNPERVTIAPEKTTAEKVDQSFDRGIKSDKIKLLVHLIETKNASSTLVFSRTKHGANKIVKKLDQANIEAQAIHGNKSQAARVKALNGFKEGSVKVLVATDIAARGIDVEELSLVVNYDLPNIPETYVHRIGRTGRAEASGEAISFCDAEEIGYLRDIQKLIKQEVPLITAHPFVDTEAERAPQKAKQNSNANRGPRNNSRNKNKSRRFNKPSKN